MSMREWAIRFKNQKGRSFLFSRDGIYLSDVVALAAGLKPVAYFSIVSEDEKYAARLARFFGLEWMTRPSRFQRNRRELFLSKSLEFLHRAGVLLSRNKTGPLEWSFQDAVSLLGYPSCCAKFLTGGKFSSVNVAYLALRNTKTAGPFPFYLNNLFNGQSRPPGQSLMDLAQVNSGLRLSMFQIIPWHPCRYDCPESLRRGRALWVLLKTLIPEFARLARETLSQTFLCWDRQEFAILKNIRGGPSGWRYQSVGEYPRSLLPQSDMEMLKRGNRITLRGACVEVFQDEKLIGRIKRGRAFLVSFEAN